MSTGQTGTREIVVYTQPHCASCNQVERLPGDHDAPFVVLDVSGELHALEEIASRAYMSMQVMQIGGHRGSELQAKAAGVIALKLGVPAMRQLGR